MRGKCLILHQEHMWFCREDQDKAMTSSGLEPLGSVFIICGAGDAVFVFDFELFSCDNICSHTFK